MRFVLSDNRGRARLHGFRFFWGTYVEAFDSTQHCLKCLKGKRDRNIRPDMPVGGFDLVEATGPYFYVCGVEIGFTYERNFHLAVRVDPKSTARAETFNGFTVTVEGGERLEIPPLEPGFRGYPGPFTRCRNFQFAWAAFREGRYL